MYYLVSALRFLLDLLLPRDALLHQLEEMSAEEFLAKVPQSRKLHGIESLFQYRHPLMRRAVWEIKYRNNRVILELVTEAATQILLERLSLKSLYQEVVFVPVPLSAKRLKERGYNQAEEIAKALVRKLSLQNISAEVDISIVKKVRHTAPQAETHSRKDRLNNLKKAFQLTSSVREKISGKHIILLDDVSTTGSTLLEVAKEISAHDPQNLYLCALAH